jgi:hypothetical protein
MIKACFFTLLFIPVIAFCEGPYITNDDIVLYKNYDPNIW